MVSMTWPEYLAGCCRLDGRLTRLTLLEADVLLALLLEHPGGFTRTADLIVSTWPNANEQPLTAAACFANVILELRRRGIQIESVQGCGYRIPRSGRGRPEPVQMAA